MIGAGTMLAGRYRLEQRIASGGMGDVWQGFDRVLSRTVAIKCLRAPSDDAAFVDRFRAEARTMATVSHPNVVEVYDFGDDPVAGVYLVMKYIEGESLAHILGRGGRLSAKATMRLVAEAAEALQAAHDKGVTHRDVKPGNLLLRPDGSTVLTDFGIARSTGATRHTSAGSLLGTAGYIAPERANGQPGTAASDIYSLGVVAYQCLAGHLPFVGDSIVELALRHAHDEAPPLPADVPASVRAVVTRAMAKDPSARWPSGAALAEQARRAVALVPTQRQAAVAVPVRRTSSGGRGLLVAGVATAVIIGVVATVGFVLGRDQQTDAPAANPSATNPVANVGGTSPTPTPAVTSPTPDPVATNPVGAEGAPTLAGPTNLIATPIGPNVVRLQWTDNSSGEDGFTIHNGVTSKDVGANVTTYDWTGIAAATHTCFKVRAFNSSEASSYFPAAQADWVCTTTLPGTGPAAPGGLAATPVNPSTIHLQWIDNSSDEDGFTIYNGVTSRNVGAGVTSYEWGGLVPGTYMCFKVRSYRSSGVSAYSPADPDWACTTTPAT